MSWPGAFALAAICAGFAAIAWADSYSNAATSLAAKAAADLAIENYIDTHKDELSANGYDVVRGKRLKELKDVLATLDGTEIDFGTIKKSSVLSVFDFRSLIQMTTLERIEANADLVLWCVHILGPDDVLAAPHHPRRRPMSEHEPL